MTWKSHTAIATAISLPFNPVALPSAILGSVAPDLIEYILKFLGVHVAHRGPTHFVYIPLFIIFFSFLVDFQGLLFWFGVGYLTHWIADALTPTGVPISQFDNHRIHIFGGSIRTGSYMEYIVAFALLFFSITLVNPIYKIKNANNPNAFNVYFFNYSELFEKKIIDEKTYKEKRFTLF